MDWVKIIPVLRLGGILFKASWFCLRLYVILEPRVSESVTLSEAKKGLPGWRGLSS